MLRLSRLADYATVLMCRMAGQPETIWSASQLATGAGVPSPTVSKLLKQLARSGLLNSLRGGRGGYQLARGPETISLADVIAAVDGPLGLTECAAHPGNCAIEDGCGIRSGWTAINMAVVGVLTNMTLDKMRSPALPVNVRFDTLKKSEVGL
jgi:FeS assembly SUF system regulator